MIFCQSLKINFHFLSACIIFVSIMKIIENIANFDCKASALTVGFFDGVHLGHASLLNKLTEEAHKRSLSSVVLTFAIHPREVLHANYVPKLLTTHKERMELLEKQGIDVCVLLNNDHKMFEMSSNSFIHHVLFEKLNTKYLLVGHDHHFGCDRENGYAHYKECGSKYGIEVEQLSPFVGNGLNISSSLIRKTLEEGHIKQASEWLGYKFYLEGTIVQGHKIGRSIGFPTANIAINDVRKLIPREGVYAVELELENKLFHGMLNIGIRPTFVTRTRTKSIEVNIFDFNQDIYQKKIKVFFLDYLRSEIKFDSPDKLIAQLNADRAAVLKWFEQQRS